MKIYYIANARMPTEKAHGIQLAKMCEAFVEEGVDLELIVPNRMTAEKSIQDFYGLRVPIRATKLSVPDWYGYGRIGFFVSSCVFAAAYFFYLLKKRIQGEKGVLYTIDIDQFSFFLMPFIGMPYVVEIHDAKRWSLPFWMLFKWAREIVVISAIIKERLIERFGIAEEKIVICPNGVDMRVFGGRMSPYLARKQLGVLADHSIALYVGKFYGWKGISILADAAEKLRAVAIYIVGGTKEEFLKITGRSSIPTNLICAGSKNYKELPLWIQASDCAIVIGTKENEYSFYHTSPMKLFEYMASHRPIISSRTPANMQIVTEREAFFYEPDSGKSLAETIEYTMTHQGEVEKKTAAAYQKAETLTWEKRANKIIAGIAKQI